MIATATAQRRQFIRFVVSGASAAAVFFGLSYGLLRAEVQPFLASVLGYGGAFATGYLLQRTWTFSGQHAHRQALPRYALLQACCALGSGALTHVAIAMHATPFAASLATTLTASLVSYFASSRWVFPNAR